MRTIFKHQHHNHKKRLKGFTLIELMIVVAIIGALAAFAIPSYMEYVRKTRRLDAKDALNSLMLTQQAFKNQRLTFTTDLSNTGLNVSTTSPEGWYRLTAETCAAPDNNIANCVLLTAARIAGQRQANDPCGSFTLDSRGNQGAIGVVPPNTIASCWQ